MLLLGVAFFFNGHDAFHVVGALFGIAVFIAIVVVYRQTTLTAGREWMIGVAGAAVAAWIAWALWPQAQVDLGSRSTDPLSIGQDQQGAAGAPNTTPGPVVSKGPPSQNGGVAAPSTPTTPIMAGPRATQLDGRTAGVAVGGRRVWFVTENGFGYIKPADGLAAEQTFPFPAGASDIAADRRDLVITRAGTAYFYDARTGRRRGRPIHFSERGGPVAVTRRFAWLCNAPHSKVDRVDLSTHAFKELPVPGKPTAASAGGGYAWVVVNRGWIVMFDAATGKELRRRQIVRGPAAIVNAYGYLWVAHPALGIVTRLDPLTGLQKRGCDSGSPWSSCSRGGGRNDLGRRHAWGAADRAG